MHKQKLLYGSCKASSAGMLYQTISKGARVVSYAPTKSQRVVWDGKAIQGMELGREWVKLSEQNGAVRVT